MSPSSDVAVGDNGRRRATQAKLQAQGAMNKGTGPGNQNQNRRNTSPQHDSITAEDQGQLCVSIPRFSEEKLR